MDIIALKKGEGKTSELIKRSAKTGYYIVCMGLRECARVKNEAELMGLKIPYPITFDDFQRQAYGTRIPGLLIDNVEHLLQHMAVVHIGAATIRTNDGVNIEIAPNKKDAAWNEDYPPIPMGEITDEARELAVRWGECEDPGWIENKVKLASDIMNYARRVSEGKVKTKD